MSHSSFRLVRPFCPFPPPLPQLPRDGGACSYQIGKCERYSWLKPLSLAIKPPRTECWNDGILGLIASHYSIFPIFQLSGIYLSHQGLQIGYRLEKKLEAGGEDPKKEGKRRKPSGRRDWFPGRASLARNDDFPCFQEFLKRLIRNQISNKIQMLRAKTKGI